MKKDKLRIVFSLFLTFFKIGLFTFGGGYAMIAVIEDICVERKKWITHDDMMNVTVIAESTPGPIAINCATFVGYKQGKFWGSVAATFGVIFPSFLIIFAISKVLDNFLQYKIIANAFKGIKVAVGILIIDAAIRLFKKSERNLLNIIIMSASIIAMITVNLLSLRISSIVIIIASAVVSVSVYFINQTAVKK